MSEPILSHLQLAPPTLLEGAGVIGLSLALTLCGLGRAVIGRLRSLR